MRLAAAHPRLRVLLSSAAPDLEFRVVGPAEDNSVEYVLHSPRGGDYNYASCGRRRFYSEPQPKLQLDLDRLSDLARRRTQDMSVQERERVIEEIATTGRGLYSEVTTTAFANEYARRIRDYRVGASLIITTEEPWIPWEILGLLRWGRTASTNRVRSPSGSTWRGGSGAAGTTPEKLKFSTAVCIQAMDGPGADKETACLQGLADAHLRIVGPLRTRGGAGRLRGGGPMHLSLHRPRPPRLHQRQLVDHQAR